MEKQYDNEGKGALWAKVAKSGVKYYSGKITIKGEDVFVSMFKNDKKENDKQPDFNILVNEPREQKADSWEQQRDEIKEAFRPDKEDKEEIPF